MNSMREALSLAVGQTVFHPAPDLVTLPQVEEVRYVTIDELRGFERNLAEHVGALAEAAFKANKRKEIERIREMAARQEGRLGDRIRFSILVAEIDTLSSVARADEVTHRLTNEVALRFRGEAWPRYDAVGNREAMARLRDGRNLSGYFIWRGRHYFPTKINPEPKGQVLIKHRIVPAIARVTASMRT